MEYYAMSNPPTNLGLSQAMPVKLPSSNNAIGDGGNTAGSYDSQGWDGYIIYLRLHLLQEHRGAVLLINADPRP